MKPVAMKRIIITAVFEFIADTAADLYAKVRSDCNIAFIKQAVDIAAEQKAIINSVWSFEIKRLDMGSFKGRESVLFCDGASSAVCIGNQDPERTLS